jgi:hypothetical protein
MCVEEEHANMTIRYIPILRSPEKFELYLESTHIHFNDTVFMKEVSVNY